MNIIVGLALLDYFSNKWLVNRELFEYSLRLQNLNTYRNETIIWHWIRPINKEIIEKKLDTKDVEWFFKSILKRFFWEENSWRNILWIDKLNEKINDILEIESNFQK